MDVGLKRELEEKVRAGERLTREDGVALYESDDLAWLGGLAHEVRTRKNGDVVHFNVNRHLNMTNVCTASCAYCSFQRKPGEKDAYTMRIEEAVRLAKAMEGENLTELHIVNGLHPNLPWRYYPRSLRELKEALPNVSLKAFTATEIHHFETISGLTASEILDELIDAGLESLTGGGAEIFDWEVRQHIVDHRTHWEDWSRIHRLAHEKGLKTPSTMLYGHIEEPRHRVDHVLRLRELQDETGGFQVFIPLRYQHDFVDMKDGKVRNRLQARTQMATGAEALKTFAVSRLLFDNVPHVKVFWVMHGVQTAQLALQHGADDMDGSVVEYKITHDADNYGTPNKLTREDLLDLIRDAGFRPVERNTRYEIIREYDGPGPGPPGVAAAHAGVRATEDLSGRRPSRKGYGGPVPLRFTLDPAVGPALRDGILALWTDVSNAGGAVGFVPPVDRETVRPELLKHLAAMAEGRHRLLVGQDDGRRGGRDGVPLLQHPPADAALGLALHGDGAPPATRDAATAATCWPRPPTRPAASTASRRSASPAGAALGLEDFYGSCGYKEVGRVPGGDPGRPGRRPRRRHHAASPALRPAGAAGTGGPACFTG